MALGRWLDRWGTYAPDRTALVDAHSGRRWTYEALAFRVRKLAGAIATRWGIGPGDRVAVLAHNTPETLELLFACARLGAILVPINFRLASAEVAYVLGDAEPKVLFYGPECRELAWQALALQPGAQPVPFVADREEEAYADVLASGREGACREVDLDDPLLILYTSGTTGRPKGAILTHGTLTSNAVNTQVGWGLRHEDVTLTHTPFFHTGGLNVLTTPLFHIGGTVVLQRSFEAAEALDLVARERCTVLFAVPTMFQMMAEADAFADADLSSVRFFITGGAPCPVPLILLYDTRGIVFKQGYGLTEAGPNCFTLDARDAVRKAGTVGFPNMHVEVRIVDDEGRDVARGDIGELLIRGPHVFPGYWRNEAATRAALREGWLHTGDLVCQDDEGYTRIVDRKKDMYISGGENVYPAEVERVLLNHPAVREVAVVGVPDAKWGEVGRAYVAFEPEAAVTAADLDAWLSGQLARYKTPRSYVFPAALPRTATGKVHKPGLVRLDADVHTLERARTRA
ncbi:MAG: long-chain fatty acid--CoA ligase [Candidatus Sericytochromatia bacterium]|nr:long-chain fatty acid--CoA ligase [Candidatus Tanganyikabacteria bacterium]